MLTYNIENRGNVPLYIYLYNCIKKDIENGLIRSNEKLPSKRTLAQHLKISVLTVQNAYALLLSEGHVYSREKSGYYASELDFTVKQGVKKRNLPFISEESNPKYFIDFCENSINVENFPFSVWSKQMREVLCERDKELLSRIQNIGAKKLRKAIADFLYRFRGMEISQDQIIIGAGTEYLYGLLLKLLGKDKIYAVENPGYKRIAEIYQAEDVDCRYICLDKHGMSVENLRECSANIVHISPSHHFPTGIVMPVKRRQEILKWASEDATRYIIEDDYDSEFRFVGKAVPTLQSTDVNEKVIYINTFSKTISPAIRISYMVLPIHLINKFKNELGFYSCTVSSFEQYTLAKFIENGHFERHINRMRKAYKLKRDYIINIIKSSLLGNKTEIYEENSGLHFIMKLKTDIDDEEFVNLSKNSGINISCLSQYSFDKQNTEKSMVIINYSGINTKQIEKAMNILAEIIA
jgi:GntR family transcriptional regulator/MocR family aminotransferase